MATLGSNKLTGIEDIDSSNSAVSNRYVKATMPPIGGTTNSFLVSQKETFKTWIQRTANIELPYKSDSWSWYDYGINEDNLSLHTWYLGVNNPSYFLVAATTDCVTWSLRTIPKPGVNNQIYSVDYANNLWFIKGSDNLLTSSTDSIHWTLRTIPASISNTDYTLGKKTIVYGNGAYVSIQNSGYLYGSTDAIHWKARTSRVNGRSGVFSEGNFIFIGGGFPNGQRISASTDSIHWTLRTLGNNQPAEQDNGYLHQIVYLDTIGKYFVSAPYSYSLSTDAIDWDHYPSTFDDGMDSQYKFLSEPVYDNDFREKVYYSHIRFGNSNSQPNLFKTTDLIHWTTIENALKPSTYYNSSLYSAFKTENDFIILQSNRLNLASPIPHRKFISSSATTSSNERDVFDQPKGTVTIPYSRVFEETQRYFDLPLGTSNVYVEAVRAAPGGGNSGISGVSQPPGTYPLIKTLINLDPTKKNSIRTLIGRGGAGNNNMGSAARHKDALVANNLCPSISAYSCAHGFLSTGSSNGTHEIKYVLGGGSGRIYVHDNDTFTWTVRTSALTGTVQAMEYGNNLFVASDNSGHLSVSTDTIHWQLRTRSYPSDSYTIRYFNSLWHNVHSSYYSVSTDTIHWALRTTPVSSTKFQIGYDSSTGIYCMTATGTRQLMSSTDSVHWVFRTTGKMNFTSYNSTTEGVGSNNNGLWVMNGNYGSVTTSTDTIHWKPVDWVNTLGLSLKGTTNNQSGGAGYIRYGHQFISIGDELYMKVNDYPDHTAQGHYIFATTDGIHWRKDLSMGTYPEHGNSGAIFDFYYNDDTEVLQVANNQASAIAGLDTMFTVVQKEDDGTTTTLYKKEYTSQGEQSTRDYGSVSYNGADNGGSNSGVSDGINFSNKMWQSSNNYKRSPHEGFFIPGSGAGGLVIGNGGSYSQTLYGNTKTASGGVYAHELYEIEIQANGSSNYVLSGTDRNGSVSGSNATVTVKSGDVIAFTLNNASGHPVWIKNNQSTGYTKSFDSRIVKNNGKQNNAVIVFNTTNLKAGTYYYNCQHHSSMRGSIVVQEAINSPHGDNAASSTFSGSRFSLGAGGGAAYRSDPDFWQRNGLRANSSVGYPDSKVFGEGGYSYTSSAQLEYDTNYNLWVFSPNQGGTGAFSVSTDSIHWTLRTVGFPQYGTRGRFATNGSGFYVLLGQYNVATSTDTVHWKMRTIAYTSQRKYDIAYGNGQYLVAGDTYANSASTDGIHWMLRTVGGSSGSHEHEFASYGNGQFVLCNDGYSSAPIITSTDTIHWQRRTVPTQYYGYGASFTNNRWFLAGNSKFAVSTDVVHWELRTVPTNLYDMKGTKVVKYGNYLGTNVYMAGGNGNGLYYSTDTIHWNPNRITSNNEGATAGYYTFAVKDGSGANEGWRVAGYNGSAPDGVTNYLRAFYEPGGHEYYIVGNGGNGGVATPGGGAGSAVKVFGTAGVGGGGYVQFTWW